jgi:hypothetical protein
MNSYDGKLYVDGFDLPTSSLTSNGLCVWLKGGILYINLMLNYDFIEKRNL